MNFITLKTDDGRQKGKIAFYPRTLQVSRQGFYDYPENRNKPWKYRPLAAAMLDICGEDVYNDTYGRVRMHQALLLKKPENVVIPSERTVYRIMEEIGLSHMPKRKPNGITKADRASQKAEDLLRRDFFADEPCVKCVTDITEIKGKDGKLYAYGIFDCFDLIPLGLCIDTNMKAPLCVKTMENAVESYPELRGAILHSNRGSQYTSEAYRQTAKNSASAKV